MSGILAEIAAAKSLTENLYNFVCRLKNAGLDIGELDLKLRNDWLLLLRYHSILGQRLPLLGGHEICHLRDYFRAISRMLLKCMEKIKRYERKGKLGKTAWCVFGNEVQDAEMKMAEWIGGLMSWAVVVDADQRLLVNMPHDSLQFNPDEQHDYSLRLVDSTDQDGISATAH